MKNKHNKRKEASNRSRPPKRRGLKNETDKDVFKRRKFIKNNHVAPVVENWDEEEPSSEEELSGTGFGKFLQLFGSSSSNTAVDSGGSEDDSDGDIDVEAKGDGIVSDSLDNTRLESNSEGSDNELESSEDDLSEESEEVTDTQDDAKSESLIEEIGEETVVTDDPFSAHYETDLPSEVADVINADIKNRWLSSNSKFPELGSLQIQNLKLKQKLSEAVSSQMKLVTSQPQLQSDLQRLNLKQMLSRNLPLGGLSGLQKEVLNILGDYKDLLYTDRRQEQAEDWRMAYTLHALNHALKTRTRILNNNTKYEARDEGEDRLRDQGFTRPKVLIIVPFKESCRRVVELMIKLLFPANKGSVVNRKRFNKDFAKIETARKDKPDDYYDLFEGDIDDSFKIGLAVTKKSLKLYTDFYNSDIIISSPLGLRLVTGADGEEEERGADSDFLSSIEVLVLDQADIFLMQNFDHVTSLVAQMHKQPKDAHGVDFSRVRLWSLDGHSKYYRQTVVLSSIPAPELNSLWNSHCLNYSGRVRSTNTVSGMGSLSRVVSDVPLVWHRVTAMGLKDGLEQRFKYFTEKIMPQFNRDCMDHSLVFVPSYFDFVKVRNWFKASDLDFSEISEYTKDKRIAKARDEFYHNEKHFLLYTERAHFYRRFRLKGVRHLVVYQPPTFGWVLSDLCNMMQSVFQNPRGGSDSNMSITILYNRFDVARLSLCVGSTSAEGMLSAEQSVHKYDQASR